MVKNYAFKAIVSNWKKKGHFLSRRFSLLLVSMLLISPLITGYLLNVPTVDQVTAQPGGWPSISDWISLNTDPDEPGCDDDRNVIETFYFVDTEFIYLRMETVNPAGWSGTGPGSPSQARFKWWFDTVGQDASIFGTSVANAEFQLILEDRFNNGGGVTGESTPRDGLGELTFMDDFEHEQFTTRWNNPAASPVEYVRNMPGTTQSTDSGGNSTHWVRVLGTGTPHPPAGGTQSAMSDPNIGYMLSGNFVDMYVSLTALHNPAKICLIWATDIHNVNLDQAPNCDRPEEVTCKPDVGIPVINIDVDKTLTTPASGHAEKGDTVLFTVTITNTGQTTLVTVPLEDFYDSDKLQYASANPTPDHGPHIHSPGVGHLGWDDLTGAGTLAPGGDITVTITFTALEVLTTSTTTNMAEVTEAIDENDNKISGEDDASVTINTPPPSGDVSINKTLLEPSEGKTSIGGTVSYSINITNTGSATLTTVQLQDLFDNSKLTFQSATPNATSVVGGTITWNDLTVNAPNGFGSDLAPSASFIVHIRFTAAAVTDTPSRDDSTVTASPETGGSFTDEDFAFVTILAPDVHVVKTLISPTGDAQIGDNIIFEIEITNTGGVPLVLVPLIDTYDSSILQFVSANPAPNTVVLGTISWDDLTGPAPNGFNQDLEVALAHFMVTITFLAINATFPEGVPTTVNMAEVNNAEDESQNQVSDDESSPIVIGFPPITLPIAAPVGGFTVPMNKLTILMPYLVLVGLIGLVFSTYYFRKRSKV